MKFAPGTPESVMREETQKFYNRKVDKNAPINTGDMGSTPRTRPRPVGGSAPMPVRDIGTGNPAFKPKVQPTQPMAQPSVNYAAQAGMKKGGYVSKGGKINLGSGRVSTAEKGKKNPKF